MAKFLTGDDPPIIGVRAADAEMNAAIAHARDTLPTFWASYQAPKPTETGHALKVRFDVGAEVEHVWVRREEAFGRQLFRPVRQ
jgi:hypothetical protein